MRPTTVLRGINDGVDKYWERTARDLLMIDSVAEAFMGGGNTLWFTTATMRCKLKAHKIQLLQVHLPMVVASTDFEGRKTWTFTVYGSTIGGKYEHIM